MIYFLDVRVVLDWKYLFVFLTGILFGFLFLLLVYLYSVILSLKKKRKYRRKPIEVDELEIELLIKDAQNQFKNKELRKSIGLATYLKQIISELSEDIAKKYYPTSKYPLLELSVEESLELTNYISQRINEFLSAKIIAPLKRRTIAQIKSIYDVKTKIEETKIVEASKKVGAKKISKTVFGVLNVLNPAYWVKRLTVDKLYDIIIVRICLASIAIVGEETYKIYSKSVFKKPEELDVNIDELYEAIIKEEEL
ncbi:MAG: hypothetical protein GX149_03865 [Acholeplasmataceae bacterium]|nr:hypothetical protein [Acholeplasmataceae bacterium]